MGLVKSQSRGTEDHKEYGVLQPLGFAIVSKLEPTCCRVNRFILHCWTLGSKTRVQYHTNSVWSVFSYCGEEKYSSEMRRLEIASCVYLILALS